MHTQYNKAHANISQCDLLFETHFTSIIWLISEKKIREGNLSNWNWLNVKNQAGFNILISDYKVKLFIFALK